MKRTLILVAALGLMLVAFGDRGNAKVIDPQPMSMGIKPAQFQERFNSTALARKHEYRITSIKLKPSTEIADNWQYGFTNKVGFLAPVNRSNGTIRSLTFVGSGDGSVKSGADIMFILGLLIRSIDPALTDETANSMTLNLMGAVQNGKPVEVVRNGIRYGSALIPQVGLFVAINPSQ